ncbi:hypothetical protein [Falsiroseomonas sp.]|jgi:hypothetical protein|uniref:hypothetical protein n=1 Tax=Falsiroseomonas sp. TaxID=2870721 RepID=UPI003F711C2E
MVDLRKPSPLAGDGLDALAEMAGDDPRARDALARAGRVGLRIGLAGPALLLYALSAAEAVRRGDDPAARLVADLARAGIEEPFAATLPPA